MGRHLNIKANLTATAFTVAFILSASASMQAQARAPEAQTVPVISLDTPLARDAETFQNDKTLDAACRRTGQTNSVCLCVTHIMKYELTLSEYRAATRLYGQSGDRAALRQTLRTEGVSASDIDMAEQMERSLIEDPDFALRCSEAKSYYRNGAR